MRTLDHGNQPIRWIGQSRVRAVAALAPVVFAKGSIGNSRELRVSPAHRMLLAGAQAEALFGSPEVLVPAKALINDRTIRQEQGGEVDYFHLLFDRHEIVMSNGTPSESFHPAHAALTTLDQAAKAEIEAIFPQLSAYGGPARMVLQAHETGLLAAQVK